MSLLDEESCPETMSGFAVDGPSCILSDVICRQGAVTGVTVTSPVRKAKQTEAYETETGSPFYR
jgi:hypothetical protein